MTCCCSSRSLSESGVAALTVSRRPAATSLAVSRRRRVAYQSVSLPLLSRPRQMCQAG